MDLSGCERSWHLLIDGEHRWRYDRREGVRLPCSGQGQNETKVEAAGFNVTQYDAVRALSVGLLHFCCNLNLWLAVNRAERHTRQREFLRRTFVGRVLVGGAPVRKNNKNGM